MRAVERGGRTARCVYRDSERHKRRDQNVPNGTNHQMLDRRLKLGWRGGRFS